MNTRHLQIIVFVLFVGTFVSFAAESVDQSKTALAEGLIAEEVEDDPVKALADYEKVLENYTEHKRLAAAALLRLAEVHRKQGNQGDAVSALRKLISEFPAAAAENQRAREILTAMGEDLPAKRSALLDKESAFLAELKKMAIDSPDRLREEQPWMVAIKQDYQEVYAYLIKLDMITSKIFLDAVKSDRTSLVELFLAKKEVEKKTLSQALYIATAVGNLSLCKKLLQSGAEVNSWHANDLAEVGVNDKVLEETSILLQSIIYDRLEIFSWLLANGADPNFNRNGNTPLHHIYGKDFRVELAKSLLAAGADPTIEPRFAPNTNEPESITKPRNHIERAAFEGDSELLEIFLDTKIKLSDSKPFDCIREKGDTEANIKLLIERKAPLVRDSKRLLLICIQNEIAPSALRDLIAFHKENGSPMKPFSVTLDDKNALRGESSKDYRAKIFGETSKVVFEEVLVPGLQRTPGVHVFDAVGLIYETYPELKTQEQFRKLAQQNMYESADKVYFRGMSLISAKDDSLKKRMLYPVDYGQAPKLSDGDIIVMGHGVATSTPSSEHEYASAKFASDLMSRKMEFPISVVLDSNPIEYTINRNLSCFDPYSKQLPDLDPRTLVSLIAGGLNSEGLPRILQVHNLTIFRKGSVPMTMAIKAPDNSDLRLEPNDRLVVERLDPRPSSWRASEVYVTLENGNFFTSLRPPAFSEKSSGENELKLTVIDCLLWTVYNQFIEAPSDKTLLHYKLLYDIQNGRSVPIVIPRLDLSKVIVTSLLDPSKKPRVIDLTQYFALVNQSKTRGEIFQLMGKAIQLDRGDLVTFTPERGFSAEAWSPLSAEASSFLSFVSSGQYSTTDGNGRVELIDFSFQPMRWIVEDKRVLPDINSVNVASICLHESDSSMTLIRNDFSYNLRSTFGLTARDGDRVLSRLALPPGVNPRLRPGVGHPLRSR